MQLTLRRLDTNLVKSDIEIQGQMACSALGFVRITASSPARPRTSLIFPFIYYFFKEEVMPYSPGSGKGSRAWKHLETIKHMK